MTAGLDRSARAVVFTVLGTPQPAGSKTAFRHKHTGKVQVVDAAKRSRPWKQEVAGQAQLAMDGRPLLDGPLRLEVVFFVARPRGHYGKRGLLPSADPYPAKRPDLTKLLRAIEDACTGIVWRDDAQIVTQTARKVYGEPACAFVCAWPLADLSRENAA